MSKKTKKRKLRARRNKANHGKKPRAGAKSARRTARGQRRRGAEPARALLAPRRGGASSSDADDQSARSSSARSSARHASSAARNARLIPHGCVYSRAGTADGPRRRISRAAERGLVAVDRLDDVEQRDLGRGAREPVAAARPLHRLEHARARERLQVLGQVRRGHAVVLGELGRRAAPDRAGATASTVHACTPHSTPSDSRISRILYIRYSRHWVPCPPRWRPSTKSSSSPMPTSTSCSRRRSNG